MLLTTKQWTGQGGPLKKNDRFPRRIGEIMAEVMKAEDPSDYEFRRALTNIQPGEHFCMIYTGSAEQVGAVVPVIKAGLDRNERCVYVADEESVNLLRWALGHERLSLEQEVELGRILLLTREAAFLQNGVFCQERVLRFCHEAHAEATRLGFSGVRFFAEMTWTFGLADGTWRFKEYGLNLNQLARELPAVIICQFDRHRAPPEAILGVLETHPHVIYGRIAGRNPYFLPPEEMDAPNRAELAVDRLLSNLRESEHTQNRLRERFIAFMDHLPAFAWMKDLDGRYLFINEVLRAVPSHAKGWQGKTDEDLWPPEVAADFRASDARVMAEKKTVQVIEPYEVEGEVRYGLVTKFPIFDRGGRLLFLGGTSVNITERIRAEQALRKSEERFRELAENIHEIFWVQDAESGRLEYVSPAYEHVWQRKAEELLASPLAWVESVHADDRERVLRGLALPLEKRDHDHRYRVVWPDGTVRWIRDRAFPVRDADGRINRLVGLAEDVTEATLNQQALQQANERLQMVSRRVFEVQEHERRHLARELHDEIGQALTAAKINLKSAASAAQPEVVGLLSETAGILDGLLGKVREISLNLRPSLLDDLGLVPALRSLLDQQTRRGGLALQFYASGVPELLDPETKIACFRIAQEALTNVLRHANARAVSLEMWVEEEELHLTITDDGKGFPTAHLDRKGHRAETFGLMGIKERAELAGGVALILSTPGNGTIVDVRMPLHRHPSSEEVRP